MIATPRFWMIVSIERARAKLGKAYPVLATASSAWIKAAA
jgi:hypothetical protein